MDKRWQEEYEKKKRYFEEHYYEILKNTSFIEAPKKLQEAILYPFRTGGKRLRPILTLEIGEIFHLEKFWTLHLALAIECIHTYSLVHDDLPSMDDDSIRRGKPTVHVKYDEGIAILVGDALHTLAFEVLSLAKVSPSGMKYFSQKIGASGLIGGQFLDITHHNNIEKIHIGKTARLMQAALVLPLIEQKINPSYIYEIEKWGLLLGKFFQLRDDYWEYLEKKENLKEHEKRVNFAVKKTQEAVERLKSHKEKLEKKAKEIFPQSYFFQKLPSALMNAL